jgi:hypothetical protein
MKRLSPEDITEHLSEEQLEILAEMLDETPVSKEWLACHKKLSGEQIFQIHNKLGELIQRREEQRINAMTREEKRKEDEKWQLWHENLDPNGFRGNMGQPETPQEYKNRYGVWPPGYDENGNKLE